MVWFVFAIIFIIAAIIVPILIKRYSEEDHKALRRVTAITLSALAVIFFALSCIAVVPTGYTGILTTFGKVEDRVLAAGANFIAPWQAVTTMDNRTQKAHMDASAFSSDIQQVDLQISVNYCIDQQTARDLYRRVGTNYYDNVMLPRILENVKATFSKYTAENLVAKRDVLSSQIVQNTADDLSEYGIVIVSISIEDIDFTDAFTDAVEAKQVAAQKKLTAETEQAQLTMEERAKSERAIIIANADAEKAVIAANADLEVQKVQADATLYARQKEAEGNREIAQSLSSELNTYYWIKQWDGKLPTTTLGESSGFMINLGSVEKSPE
ncbi:prohibitin family protein [Candidatus Saccharibacteria bacterium]|nr:prohibitin family protein [Candidatus Saccharibacteria bacterium]